MSKRSTASGTICFGLVSIPVKFFLTASAETVSFNMITSDGNRVKQKLVDTMTGKDVDYNSCLKGYEYEKDKFVTFTRDELKAMGETDGGTMEIMEFVPANNLKPVQVEKTYYLDAGKGGDKAYRLLVAAMEKKGKCAVAQWTSRGRQHLILLGVAEGTLVAHQMYYADEIRAFELDCATYAPRDAEIDLACRLMDTLTTDEFDASKYRDTYRDRVNKAVEQKRGGQEVSSTDAPAAPPINDIFEALKKSLGDEGVKVTSTHVEEVVKPAKKATKRSA